mgnify:CR=1 FL=1
MSKDPRSGAAPKSMRLAKYLAGCGVGSRRHCEDFIREGQVTVNERTVDDPATNVDPEVDEVAYKGRPVRPRRSVYLALHKPRGYVSTQSDPHAERVISELFPRQFGRLFTIGRLDRDSEGLILVTNDGEFAQRLQHPRYGVLKRYRVTVAGKPPPDVLKRMEEGFEHGGEFLKAESARWAHNRKGRTLLITLREGRNREIRRLCSALGMTVQRLTRQAVGPVLLRGIRPGKWRHLTEEELDRLRSPQARLAGQRPRPPLRGRGTRGNGSLAGRRRRSRGSSGSDG